MQRKYFYNLITSILISSFILAPFFVVSRAKAQVVSGYANGLGVAVLKLPQCQAVMGRGIKSLFSGIGDLFSGGNTTTSSQNNQQFLPTIAEGGDIFDEQNEINAAMNKTESDNLKSVVSAAGSAVSGIYVTLPETTELKLKEIQAHTKAAEESAKAAEENDLCVKSIGKLIIKMLLQKLTVSTVEWINSGFDGSPSFIQNPDKFFSDIAKTEFLQFGGEVMGVNEKFGKDWLRNMALSYDQKFQDNARYSLNEVMQQKDPTFTAETFQQDFSMGGWDAWTSLTQTPANNPIGFKLMADNEIQRRLAGTVQSTAENTREMLAQANGFLGDQRCIEPKGVTQTEDRNARAGDKNARKCIGGFEYVTPGKMISDAATNVIGYQNNAYLNVEDLNDAVAAMIDALLGQFSNKIMAKGFANIDDEGSNGNLVLTDYQKTDTRTRTQRDYSSALLSSSWLQANSEFNIRTDLTQALIDEQRTYIDKLAEQNKELLSTTDGKPYKLGNWTFCANEGETCSFSGTQEIRYGANNTYTYKTVTNSTSCNNATFGDPTPNIKKTCEYGSGAISNTYGLISVINQLDYCIPGPHPGWENDSREALAAATNKILPETRDSLKDKDLSAVTGLAQSIVPMAAGAVAGVTLGPMAAAAIGLTAGSIVPVVGTIIGAVVGTVVGLLIGLLSGDVDDGTNVRAYYSYIIGGFTGFYPPYGSENDKRAGSIESKTGVVNALNSILDNYSIFIDKIFTSDVLPSVTKDAAAEYNQLRGYYQMIKNNGDKISSLKTTINILGEIKSKVDELNRRYKINNEINENDYENELQAQINAFGRISADMINGADIASADKILKQIKDKRIYIYNNLLKGPYGCEKELETPKNFPAPWNDNNTATVKRMTYPFPIIYDYNKLSYSQNIPDGSNTPKLNPWWNSGFINKTPPKQGNQFYNGNDLILGPGFLSFVYFSAAGKDDNDASYRGPERLDKNTMLPHILGDQQWVSVGLRTTGSDNSKKASAFETMIGIY